jgi:hypothetical protein
VPELILSPYLAWIAPPVLPELSGNHLKKQRKDDDK